VKVTLTIPALERLIGGDTELEVEIRKSIVYEFSKRHLSAVAKEVYGDIEKAKEQIRTQVLGDMGAVKMEAWSSGRYKLTSEATEAIRSSVRQVIREAVTEAAREAWVELRPEIIKSLKNCYDREALAVIKEQVRKDIVAALGK
jgi:hypothetical protein